MLVLALGSYAPQTPESRPIRNITDTNIGKIVDWVYADTVSVISCTAAFAQAVDTVPATANGTLVLTTPSITPKSASNFLLIEFFCTGAQNANTQPGLFFVRSGQGSAFWAATGRNASSAGDPLTGKIIVPVNASLANHPSGTAARTYTAYIGVGAGFSYTVNGVGGSRLLGGVQRATFQVTEIEP